MSDQEQDTEGQKMRPTEYATQRAIDDDEDTEGHSASQR